MNFLEIVKTLIPLFLILGGLFAVLLLVRRYSFSINGKKAKLLNVEVINNQLILPKKYISVVRVEDKLLVLGISENNISLLKEYDYKPDLTIEEKNGEFKQTFVDMLKQNLGMK